MSGITYSLTCVSSQVQQQMLLKSLIAIVGLQTQSKTEWTYADEGHADVVIVDYDDNAQAKYPNSIVVGFSRDSNLINDMPFALHKPLRSRDLLSLLSLLDEHLSTHKRKALTHHNTHANNFQDDNNDPLDIIFTLIRNNAQTLSSLHFNEQVAYLDPLKKKVFLPHDFTYQRITKDCDFQYYSMPSLPDVPLKQISVADFFYEFTLAEKPAHLLTVLNSDSRFQIKQWPNFANNQNTKAVIKISAYFSKQKATLQTAARDLSLDAQQLFGFINAVHAQNLLIFDSEIAVPQHMAAPDISHQPPPISQETKKVSGLFGRIRQRLGL